MTSSHQIHKDGHNLELKILIFRSIKFTYRVIFRVIGFDLLELIFEKMVRWKERFLHFGSLFWTAFWFFVLCLFLSLFSSIFKGWLISESFSFCFKSPKKVPNHYLEHYPHKVEMLRIVIRHVFFGNLNQSEKLSEINQPLSISSWVGGITLSNLQSHHCSLMIPSTISPTK